MTGPDLTGLIELHSGNFLDVGRPDPGSIVLGDVAHGLSLTCRFSGQCHYHYSICEHAILVSHRLREQGYNAWFQLAGLHHDSAEAFVTDVPRPVKPLIEGFAAIEDRVLRAVLEALGLTNLPVDHRAIKEADSWALAQEAGELMPSQGRYWSLGDVWDGECRCLGCDGPAIVRERWTRRHRYLVSRVKAAGYAGHP